jgi:hypothetical protein
MLVFSAEIAERGERGAVFCGVIFGLVWCRLKVVEVE